MDSASDKNHSIKGDRALQPGDRDLLGFQEVAQRIAISLVDRASENGLVVGLEGAWGSGKSSLLFLISEELKKLPDDKKPSVINFRPWLIGNRDALISGLFRELTKELDLLARKKGKAAHHVAEKARKADEALRVFAEGLGKLTPMLKLAGDISGMGQFKVAARVTEYIQDNSKKKKQEKPELPLEALKENLIQSLREMDHRFVITIDDVDRLEPSEVIEVLRLVRSVVDLPNVIYLLCYDSSILAHSIKKATKVESGAAYLEKIVQLTVMVPTPEPFQLRQWFSDELYSIESAKDEDEFLRLKNVIDYEGGRLLKTPRAVVRALDGVRFFWPPLRDAKADFADLVWVQLIRDGNPKLYRWIEDYCATAALVSLGTARVSDTEKAQLLESLLDACPAGYFDDYLYRFNFASQLPGVEPHHSDADKPFKIFQHIPNAIKDEAILRKRLSSPDHYRLYFALSGPSYALTSAQFLTMSSAVDSGAPQAGSELLKLHQESATGSLTKADIFLERVRGKAVVMNSAERSNLLIAFSQIMDRAYSIRPFHDFSLNSIWHRAENAIILLLHGFNASSREKVIKKMFENGAALGWLSSILRRELFAHGRVSLDRKRLESDWIFTDIELDIIVKILLGRYRKLTVEELSKFPYPISLLFAWRQAGDESGPRNFVQENIKTDMGLINILDILMITISSSARGNYKVLKRVNLEPFLDYDSALDRVNSLSSGSSKLNKRAKVLLDAFHAGNER